ALVVAVGGLTAALLRLRQPRVMLAYWQALLAACLLLPLVEPWQKADFVPAAGAATGIITKTGGVSLVSLVPFQSWVLLLLSAGVGAGLLRLTLGLWRLTHSRRAALLIAPLPSALREARALVGVEPAFYLSDRVETPATFGWLDPAIILPRWFERMEESHQRAIACHELLHVARRDWLLNLLEELVLAFFWFHPAVWWAVRSIRLSREQVVDCEVVMLTGARKPYLHALLEIAAIPRARTLPAPLFLVEKQLARRVAILVKEVRMSKPRLIASLVIALAVVVGAGWWGVKTFWLNAPARSTLAANIVAAPRHDLGKVYTVGNGITVPIPTYKPEPPYTKEARAAKLQGTVVCSVVVDDTGNVADVQVVRSLEKGLDESAMQTLRTWKFQPATKDGKPVPVKVVVEVSFRLS
ncbi:MAG: M56 family metallopeptidase, partial [Candidatus Korobacteraceae bacterium]